MAKKLIRRAPVKKQKKTRSEVYMVNLKYLGDEPTYKPGQILSNSEKARAYTWYGSMTEVTEAREWLSEYLSKTGRKEDVKKLKAVPDSLFPFTCAWIARMKTKGVAMSVDTLGFFEDRLEKAFTGRSLEEKKEEKPAAEKPNIQERIRDRVSDLIGDLEQIMDQHLLGEIKEFDAYEYCQKLEIPAQHASKMAAFYVGQYEELELVVDGSDEQVNEGYKKYGKKWARERLAFLEKMMADLLRYSGNAKKLRAPRKKKPMSVEKKLKSFKYQKEFAEMKIASVSPDQIVGAQELWTYNTKYKILSVFRALDRGGLDVKGSSIIKYDESASKSKSVGRTEAAKISTIDTVLNGGKVALRNLMNIQKTEKPLAYRINENTILLRVVKQ